MQIESRGEGCVTKMSNSIILQKAGIIFFLLLISFTVCAQKAIIRGRVLDTDNETVVGAVVLLENTNHAITSDMEGDFVLKNVPYGEYHLVSYAFGKKKESKSIKVDQQEIKISLVLEDLSIELDPVIIQVEREKTFGITHLKSVDGFGIYEGKKSEVVDLKEIDANLSTNSARQVYAKVTGLNIWESDGAGLQLGIGGRGLSPNRTANFNVRQNGYDISADALGYPESYYTPPVEALERIEIVRGAASLQYGTQFGGMVNFKFKEGPTDKKAEFISRQTGGSWGFYNSFNSLGGTIAKGKLNYYSYVQYKRGNGYRENSGFDYYNAYASINYRLTPKIMLNMDLTKMTYLAQQPGGLTDKNFESDIRKSYRSRNWFGVDWNLMAFSGTYMINAKTKINTRVFALMARRQSLGNLERIHVADFGGNRTLIDGRFQNFGNETRLMHDYKLGKQNHVFLTGVRLYHGTSITRQGDASNGSDADFSFINPNNLENSDYNFPSKNYSLFIENIFHLTSKLTLTPGIRYESIETFSEGYYKRRVFNGAGGLVVENKIEENQYRKRDFVIYGLGVNYKITPRIEIYANASQNYKAINFSDLRVVNPNFVIDENIQDETGYTADLGIRGSCEELFTYEATVFLLRYNGKIGQVLRAGEAPTYNDFRFRGNISDARNYGLEMFGELNLMKLINGNHNKIRWTIYANFAYVDARYINTEDNAIKNKQVEMVPPVILRTGSSVRYKNFRATLQYSYVHEHFSDATNAIRTSTAVEGIIPSYQVMDISLSYNWKRYTLETSVNNLLNEKYFTRRAESYPGPGILPSDGRSLFLTLQVKI